MEIRRGREGITLRGLAPTNESPKLAVEKMALPVKNESPKLAVEKMALPVQPSS